MICTLCAFIIHQRSTHFSNRSPKIASQPVCVQNFFIKEAPIVLPAKRFMRMCKLYSYFETPGKGCSPIFSAFFIWRPTLACVWNSPKKHLLVLSQIEGVQMCANFIRTSKLPAKGAHPLFLTFFIWRPTLVCVWNSPKKHLFVLSQIEEVKMCANFIHASKLPAKGAHRLFLTFLFEVQLSCA